MSSDRYLDFAAVYNDTVRYPTLTEVSAKLGISYKTVKNTAGIIRRLKSAGADVPDLVDRRGRSFEIRAAGEEFREIETVPVRPEEPIGELLDRVFAANDRYASYKETRDCIDIRIKTEGPFGVVGLPDTHLNNLGTLNRRAFEDAYRIAAHPALYAVGIGDWLDNFIVGRLEAERRKDVMSHPDSWRLLDHYVITLAPKLVAAISGNHMDWTTSAGGVDVMRRMLDEQGLGAIYDTDQVRVRLITPSGRSFTHLARHKYRGNSRFNAVHAITVHILESWQGEDVVWGGHIHVAGHTSIEKFWMGERRVVHGVQLGSYKLHDSYAEREGFRRNVPFLTPMTIHVPETGETLFFADMNRGIEVLDMLRSRPVSD